MKAPVKPKVRQLKFKIDPSMENGSYTNFFTSIHNENEFILDFGMFLPGTENIKVVARLVTNPRHAKNIARILQEVIAGYEKKFGEIKVAPRQLKAPEDPGFIN